MSAFGRTRAFAGAMTRALRNKRPPQKTPPSWYQKHALMLGTYEEAVEAQKSRVDRAFDPRPSHRLVRTSLPPLKQCHVFEKGIWSNVLQQWVRIKVSSAALREIDRMGGLDEYATLSSDDDLGGPNSVGVVLKRRIEQELLKKAAQTASQ